MLGDGPSDGEEGMIEELGEAARISPKDLRVQAPLPSERPAAPRRLLMLSHVGWTKIVALGLVLLLPASASAGPLSEAAEKAARELAMVQSQSKQNRRSRGRFWTSIALIAGGGVLAVLGGIELGDGDSGSDEDTDTDDVVGTDDGDSSEKVMLGSGIAAVGVGAILLMTGGRRSSPAITARPGRLAIRHTIRF
jgi:hypothetical protein